MNRDDLVISDVTKRFGISKDEAKKQIQELIDNKLLENNNDSNIPVKLRLTTKGSRFAEKQIIENFGEFKKVINHRGVAYKVPTVVIIREGISEQDLVNFPLWGDEE